MIIGSNTVRRDKGNVHKLMIEKFGRKGPYFFKIMCSALLVAPKCDLVAAGNDAAPKQDTRTRTLTCKKEKAHSYENVLLTVYEMVQKSLDTRC